MQQLKRTLLALAIPLAVACSSVKPYVAPFRFNRVGPLGYEELDKGLRTTIGSQQCDQVEYKRNLGKGSEVTLFNEFSGVKLRIEDITFSDIRGWIVTYKIINPDDIAHDPVEVKTQTPYSYRSAGFIFMVNDSDKNSPKVEAAIYGCY